jgi:hypothetical protein
MLISNTKCKIEKLLWINLGYAVDLMTGIHIYMYDNERINIYVICVDS